MHTLIPHDCCGLETSNNSLSLVNKCNQGFEGKGEDSHQFIVSDSGSTNLLPWVMVLVNPHVIIGWVIVEVDRCGRRSRPARWKVDKDKAVALDCPLGSTRIDKVGFTFIITFQYLSQSTLTVSCEVNRVHSRH